MELALDISIIIYSSSMKYAGYPSSTLQYKISHKCDGSKVLLLYKSSFTPHVDYGVGF